MVRDGRKGSRQARLVPNPTAALRLEDEAHEHLAALRGPRHERLNGSTCRSDRRALARSRTRGPLQRRPTTVD